MQAFSYSAPTSLEEAVSILAAAGPAARPMAGGTDLLVQLRHARRSLDLVVDIKRIPDVGTIEYSPEGGLVLGAAVPCADVAAHQAVIAHYPALADGAGLIGGVAVRQRATVGGNLCNASPSGDAIPPLIVLGAECRIAGPQGERRVPVAAFCTGPGRTILAPGELLVSLHLPPPAPDAGSRYVRFTPRAEMDIAVVGAAAWVQLDPGLRRIINARLTLGAVGPTPVVAERAARAVIGLSADEDACAEAGALAMEAVQPISDVRGTEAQRRHVAGVLARRALWGAIRRAKGESLDG